MNPGRCLTLSLLAVLACAAPSWAAAGDSTVDACLNAGTAGAPCTSAGGITGDFPLAISPDGAQVYVATEGGTAPGGSAETPTLLVFDRNGTTGALTRRNGIQGCFTTTGSSGACGVAAALNNPQEIAITSDGTDLYISDPNGSILEFSRATDGSLTLLGTCTAAGGGCGNGGTGAVNGMGAPHGMITYGDNVYVRSDISEGQGTLLVFDRQANGTLRQKATTAGCFAEAPLANCTDAAGISRGGWQLAVSSDGNNVYATGRNDAYIYDPCGGACPVGLPDEGSVATFARGADGALTFVSCISGNGLSGGGQTSAQFPDNASCPTAQFSDLLTQARSVSISADGKNVYVGADGGIGTWSRNTSNGALTGVGAVAVQQVYRMAAVPDGTEVIAESNASNGFHFLLRDPGNGGLTQRAGTAGCLTQTGSSNACNTLAALGGGGSVGVSSDSMYAYLTGNRIGVLATLHRDFAPTCAAVATDVPFQISALVQLSCTDPNPGDTVSNYAISAQPSAGTLGAVDQSAKTVRYNPFLGFSGADSFQYTATAAGVTSAPATASLTVGAPLPATPHDLAITAIKVPAKVTLTTKKPSLTKRIKVQIQNRGPGNETIDDAATLDDLVHVTVTSGGACAVPAALLHAGKPQKKLPVTLKKKGRLSVLFDITLDCANDAAKGVGHEDYEVRAHVNANALGEIDAHAAADDCPRQVTPPGVIDPFPDGKLLDKGCGAKKGDKTLGNPVAIDVVVKP